MSLSVVFVAQWSPFRSQKGYRIPLVADVLSKMRQRGIRVAFASPHLPESCEADVELVHLPESFRGSWRLVLPGARQGCSIGGRTNPPEVLRELEPQLFVAVNSNALALATALARPLSAAVALFSLGGLTLQAAFRSAGAFAHVISEYFLPQFLPVVAFANVEDSSELHRHTPLERLAPSRQLRLPIPHSVWPPLERDAAERIANLAPRKKYRITWAGRFHPDKRPEQFVAIARELLRMSDEVEICMVGAPTGRALAEIRADGNLTEKISLPGLVPNDTLAAIGRASDLMVFTAGISVTGTIFREAVASAVPVACTLDPSDSLLFCLLDVGKDVLSLPVSSPRTSAEIILAALGHREALARQGHSAAARIRGRGIEMDEFTDRVAEFFEGVGHREAATRRAKRGD